MMEATFVLVEEMGVRAACSGMGLPRASYYRARQEARLALHTVRRPRRSPLALSKLERQDVIDVLHSPEYIDVAPRTAYAMLLDAGSSWHPYRPSTASCARAAARVADVTNWSTLPMPGLNCWPRGHAKCGIGISPN